MWALFPVFLHLIQITSPSCRQPHQRQNSRGNGTHTLHSGVCMLDHNMVYCNYCTEMEIMVGTWFGEFCSCCCLPLLPQLACSILPTTYQPLFPPLYIFYPQPPPLRLSPDWLLLSFNFRQNRHRCIDIPFMVKPNLSTRRDPGNPAERARISSPSISISWRN